MVWMIQVSGPTHGVDETVRSVNGFHTAPGRRTPSAIRDLARCGQRSVLIPAVGAFEAGGLILDLIGVDQVMKLLGRQISDGLKIGVPAGESTLDIGHAAQLT